MYPITNSNLLVQVLQNRRFHIPVMMGASAMEVLNPVEFPERQEAGAPCEATLVGLLDGSWSPDQKLGKFNSIILSSTGRNREGLVYNGLHLQYKSSMKIFKLQGLEHFQARGSVFVLGWRYTHCNGSRTLSFRIIADSSLWSSI